MHIYGENIMKNLSFLTLFAFLSVSFVVADEPVDEDVEVVAEATMAESSEAAEDEDVQELGRVSVTGSRIKRVDIEGATPLITITRADIDNAGFQTVYDAVSNLTQNTGSVNGENFQAGFNASLQPINLRDFGPGRTLVLVNGKRTADYPFPYNGESASFNWGSIPLAAVERIEVLTSGASSIYGSDAVAGVVNVILVDGLERQTARVVAGAGVNKGSGGETLNFEFAGGGFGERYSYTYALEYYDEQQVPISSRSEHDSYLDANDGGLPSRGLLIRDTYSFFNPALPGFGFNHYTPDQFIDGSTAPFDPTSGLVPTAGLSCQDAGDYFRPTEEQIGNYVWYANGDWCAVDTSSNGSLTNERKRVAAFLSGTYEITDSIEAYAKIVQLETDTIGVLDNLFTPFEWVAGPQRYGSVDSVWLRNVTTDPNTGSYAFTDGYSAMMDFRIQKIFPGVYRGSSYDEEVTTVDFGLRGVLNNGYEWDMSYTENTYDVVQTGRNFLRSALFNKIHNIGGVDGFGNPCVLDQADLLDGDLSNGEVDDWYGIYAYGASFNQANCYNWDWYLSNNTQEEVEALRVDNNAIAIWTSCICSCS
jgi:outer membrane receptor protein involved in Fe transport